MNRLSTAILLACALLGSGAWAQTEEREANQPAEQKKSDKSVDESAKPEDKKDDFEYCKEKAHGLSGPERARFMTECLRERK